VKNDQTTLETSEEKSNYTRNECGFQLHYLLATAAFVNKDLDLCIEECETALVLSEKYEVDRKIWFDELVKLKKLAEDGVMED
jgi:hypothetical protein